MKPTHLTTTFKTITIGQYSAQELLEKMQRGNIHVSNTAKEIIEKMLLRSSPEEIELIKTSVRDLGFTSPPTLSAIYEKAKQRGMELCPAEVGPVLRLADKEQIMGDWYCIGMELITDSGGFPDVFKLVRYEDGLWLYYRWAFPDDHWNLDVGFVFRRRKSSQSLSTTPQAELLAHLTELLERICPKGGTPLNRGEAIVELAKYLIELFPKEHT